MKNSMYPCFIMHPEVDYKFEALNSANISFLELGEASVPLCTG